MQSGADAPAPSRPCEGIFSINTVSQIRPMLSCSTCSSDSPEGDTALGDDRQLSTSEKEEIKWTADNPFVEP
ncbi:hypothetical protein OBBRIDRAFT_795734, partial [Obba rivulosa]